MAEPSNISSVLSESITLPGTQSIVSSPAVNCSKSQLSSTVETTYSYMTPSDASTHVTTTPQPIIIATTSNTLQLVPGQNTTSQNVMYQIPVTFYGRQTVQFLRSSTPILNQNIARFNGIQNFHIPRATVPVIRIPTPQKNVVKEIQSNQMLPGNEIHVIQPPRSHTMLQTVPRIVLKPNILSIASQRQVRGKAVIPRMMFTKSAPPRSVMTNSTISKLTVMKPAPPKPTFSKSTVMAKHVTKPLGSKKPIRANTRVLKVSTTITPLKKIVPVKPNVSESLTKERLNVDIRQCFPIDIHRSVRCTAFDWHRYRQDYLFMEENYGKRHSNEVLKIKKPWDKAFQPPIPPPRRRVSPQKLYGNKEPVKAFHLTANLPLNATIGPLTEKNNISHRKKRKSQTNDKSMLKRPKTDGFESNAKSASTESIRSSGSDSGVDTLSQSSTNSAQQGKVFATFTSEQARLLIEKPCISKISTETSVRNVSQYKKSFFVDNERLNLNPDVSKVPSRGRKQFVNVKIKEEVSQQLVEGLPIKPQPHGRTYFKRNNTFKPRSKAAEWKATISDNGLDNEDLVYLHIVYNKFYDEGLLPFMDDPYKQASTAAESLEFENAPKPTKSAKSGAGQFFRQRIQINSAVKTCIDEKTRIPEKYMDDPELEDLTPNKSGCARCEPFRRRDRKFTPPDVSSVTEDGRRFIEVTKEDEDNIRQARESKKNDRRMTRHILTQIANEAPELAKLQIFKSSSMANEKLLKYAKSPIHGYGLFALCAIEPEQIIIEYVGERVRHELADFREKRYESQGMNSSYMFRLDDDFVIDATKMGNLARFINHCCNPNCYARISSRNGKKHILIYSKRYIDKGEELTYDYKFPIEDNKIECHCGAKTCRKWLN